MLSSMFCVFLCLYMKSLFSFFLLRGNTIEKQAPYAFPFVEAISVSGRHYMV